MWGEGLGGTKPSCLRGGNHRWCNLTRRGKILEELWEEEGFLKGKGGGGGGGGGGEGRKGVEAKGGEGRRGQGGTLPWGRRKGKCLMKVARDERQGCRGGGRGGGRDESNCCDRQVEVKGAKKSKWKSWYGERKGDPRKKSKGKEGGRGRGL